MASDSSFAVLAIVTASTKRATLSGGKRGAPTTNVASLTCTPLQPLDPELQRRVEINTPHELLQTITEESDIEEGDILVVGSTDYPIRSVADWTLDSVTSFKLLILEDLKT